MISVNRYKNAFDQYNTDMKSLIKWLIKSRKDYDPLISLYISRSRLLHNLNQYRRVAPHGVVAPVLKSNAYGHGLLQVAKILSKERDIPYFIVDSYFEARTLRRNGINTPILIIGYNRPETILQATLKNITFVVTSLESLTHLEGIDRPIYIHLKFDTGMHRHGISPNEVRQAVEIIGNNPDIVLTGICSHFADAGNPDPSFTEEQIKVWNTLSKFMKQEFPNIKYIHASATDGHHYTRDIDANMSRLGLGLYGLSDSVNMKDKLHLRPVLEMRSTISTVKKIERNDAVGYSGTFRAEKDMTIATIPVGYYEGLDLRLSNSGKILVGRSRVPCPIIGRISMNITTIDVSGCPHVRPGEEVVVISNDTNDPNCIGNMARLAVSHPYELAVHIPASLQRIVVP